MKNGIFELSESQMKLWKRLYLGYLSTREKLEYLFFDSQPTPEIQVLVTKYFQRNESPLPEDSQAGQVKERTFSERVLKGRCDIIVVYPRSGTAYEARIKTNGSYAIIEPNEPNTAFWLVSRKDLDKVSGGVLDLNEMDHIRQYHSKEGKMLVSDFR